MKKPISRREFIFRALQFSTLPMITGITIPLMAQSYQDGYLDLSEEEQEVIRKMFNWPSDKNWSLFDIGAPKGRESYEEVIGKIDPLFLERVDYLMIVNTSEVYKDNALQVIPAQQLVIFKKGETGTSENLFLADSKRPSKAVPTGPSVLKFVQQSGDVLWREVQRYNVSTGRSPYVKTFSGIFRINSTRSKSHFNSNPGAPMSHQLYIDFVYDNSQESGIALHGTPVHHTLGVRPDSHGCIRIHPNDAKVIRSSFVDHIGTIDNLPEVNRMDRFASPLFNADGEVRTKLGFNALIVLFNGYRNPLEPV